MSARKVFALLGIGVALVAARPAQAQESFLQRHPLSVWAGGLLPAGSLRTDVAPNLGARLQLWSPNSKLAVSADAGWLQVKGVNGTANQVPLLVNLFLRSDYRDTRLGRLRFYGGPGIGARYTDKVVPEMGIHDDWTFAWQAAVGVEWQRGWLLEGKYLAGDHPGDDGLGGVSVGYRF